MPPAMAPFNDMVAHVRAQAAARAATHHTHLAGRQDKLRAQLAALTGDSHIKQLRRDALTEQIAQLAAAAATPDECAQRVERAIATATDLLNRGCGEPDTLALELKAVLEGQPMVVPMSDDVCPTCAISLALTPDAQLSCPVCGYAIRYLDATAAAVAYGNDVEYSSCMYKRIGHLRKHMDHMQGKVRTTIPPEVHREVARVLFTRYDVTAAEGIELWMIRPALKELDKAQKDAAKGAKGAKAQLVNYRDLYKYYAQIYCELSGKPAPHFEPREEQYIYMMFKALQVPFELYKPPDRKNFINYTNVIFKCCQKLGYTAHLRHFSLMKDGDKLKKVDALMRRIFDYNGWEWIPTPTAPRKKK